MIPASGASPSDSVLSIEALRFAWPGAASPCIDIEQLDVAAGDTVFVQGPSGCGKSTLLSLMAGVRTAGAGRVALLGHDWAAMSGTARDRRRVAHVGYIFQQFNLLPYLSVIDNVLLPFRFSPRRTAQEPREATARKQAESLLGHMGLETGLWRRQAMTLSVGQQQRVAAARALIGRPELVIADEPTSALDEDHREAFLGALLGACAANRSALVFASHDQRIASRFGRHLLLPGVNRASVP